MKTVFEKMQDLQIRKNFVEKKRKVLKEEDKNFKQLENYILSDECVNDIERLKNGDYFLDYPVRFKIKKMNSKRRRVCYKYRGKDGYLLKLANFIMLDFDKIFSNYLYSYRRKYNHTKFFEKLKKVDFGRDCYVLKMDIHAYSESIKQEILLDKLSVVFKDEPEFFAFLKWLITLNKFYERGNLVSEKCSLIPGLPLSSFFYNLYLMEVDNYLKENSVLCMRYSDDIAVFVKTKEEALEMENYLISTFDRLGLTCNPDKTQIIEPKEPFTILGLTAYPNKFDISQVSIRKIFYKLTRVRNNNLRRIARKEITKEQAYQNGLSYINLIFHGKNNTNLMNWCAWSFGTITTDESLRFIDHFAEDMLRSLKSGKTSKARYRTTYKDLNDAGFKTLVNHYHNYKQDQKNRK